ncbi:cell wall hydrolase [Oceanirhabdus sp. W0125-5]|uniref:cell wall hydrolase n=1 Tax=Oceanirhabdus sp. W0125-5 TaxID=2999116 RepID=UPI0022F30C02|nr:cell wall hydrolase [Oceanirhabdus sp. W0125-5]WBW98050.1 cell wall hydrolase [Oceanirhabdus sp. W0125-5]
MISFSNILMSILLAFNLSAFQLNEDTDITLVYSEDEITNLLYKENMNPIAVFNNTYKHISITSADVDFMARVVYGESAAEPYAGKVAVASVIINRVLDDKFPSTVSGVIKQKGAFSCVKNGIINAKPNEDCYNAVYDALMGADPTNDSLFFYNPQIATCQWMKSVKKDNLIRIGNHVFFVSN